MPTLGHRSDGVPLLYAGRAHVLFGEPSLGKSWLAHSWALSAPKSVIIDFERPAETMVARMLQLGRDLGSVSYHPARGPLDYEQRREFVALIKALAPPIVVVDSWSEGMACLGLSRDSADDVHRFHDQFVRPALEAGAAVVLVDHVVKDAQSRSRFPIGSERKLALVDAAYMLARKGARNDVQLICTKDTNAGVMTYAMDHVGDLQIIDVDEHRVQVALDPPGAARAAVNLAEQVEKDNQLRANILQLCADAGELTSSTIKKSISGNDARILAILDQLATEGVLIKRELGPGRPTYYSRATHAEHDTSTTGAEVMPTRAEPMPSTGAITHAPAPPSLLGAGVGGTGTTGVDTGGQQDRAGTGDAEVIGVASVDPFDELLELQNTQVRNPVNGFGTERNVSCQ